MALTRSCCENSVGTQQRGSEPVPALKEYCLTKALRPCLIEAFRVGGEGAARIRVEVKHVPAAVELELRASGTAKIRYVVDHVAAHAVRRHQVGAAMRHQEPE